MLSQSVQQLLVDFVLHSNATNQALAWCLEGSGKDPNQLQRRLVANSAVHRKARQLTEELIQSEAQSELELYTLCRKKVLRLLDEVLQTVDNQLGGLVYQYKAEQLCDAFRAIASGVSLCADKIYDTLVQSSKS